MRKWCDCGRYIYSKRHIANENEAAKMYAIVKQANG